MIFLTELLEPKHKKKEFSCGKPLLDNYFQIQANQDMKRKLAACFVAIEPKTESLIGYYTLSNSSIPLSQIPEIFKNKLPQSYTGIPASLLGRLAIDIRFQRQNYGKLLLVDALKRSYETTKQCASFAIIVDPIDEEAENFYKKYGFIKLPDSGKMFLPMKTIEKLFLVKN